MVLRIFCILIFVLKSFGVGASNLPVNPPILGLHVINYTNDVKLQELSDILPKLAAKGINTLFLEVDYHFDFKSHPELRVKDQYITAKGALKFAQLCKKYNMRLIPQFQCLGHQSWEKQTHTLLTVYPELDLTPNAFPNNEGIYCREWNPQDPKVNAIVFKLIHEIIDAFKADAIHLGMDEIFLLNHPKSLLKDQNPGEVLAQAINDFHTEFVGKKGVEMFLWGDRFIDAAKYGYGSWEASTNGTHTALDLIPKDIIICDWHYNQQKKYPSVDLFLEKGFRVLPSSWKNPDASRAFINYTFPMNHPLMVGHLFTTWSTGTNDLINFPSMITGLKQIQEGLYHQVYFKMQTTQANHGLLHLHTLDSSLKIEYTIDDYQFLQPQVYTKPILFDKDIMVYARPVKNREVAGEITHAYFVYHKGINQEINILTKYSEEYATEHGAKTLLNGVYETESYADGEWLGFNGEDAIVEVRFQSPQELKNVHINFNNEVNAWIHHPKKVEVFGSKDGKHFELLDTWSPSAPIGKPMVSVKLDAVGEYAAIKVHAYNQLIPEGFNGANQPAWIFMDELVID